METMTLRTKVLNFTAIFIALILSTQAFAQDGALTWVKTVVLSDSGTIVTNIISVVLWLGFLYTLADAYREFTAANASMSTVAKPIAAGVLAYWWRPILKAIFEAAGI